MYLKFCQVWDRRTLNEEHPKPVGIFAGHACGIACIDSKVSAKLKRKLMRVEKDLHGSFGVAFRVGGSWLDITTRVAKLSWTYSYQNLNQLKLVWQFSQLSCHGQTRTNTLMKSHGNLKQLKAPRSTGALLVGSPTVSRFRDFVTRHVSYPKMWIVWQGAYTCFSWWGALSIFISGWWSLSYHQQ